MQLVQLEATWAYASKYPYHSTSTVSSAITSTSLTRTDYNAIDGQVNAVCTTWTSHKHPRLQRPMWRQIGTTNQFFLSDPIFSTRFSVKRGLTRTDLSLYTRIDCARIQLNISADFFAPTSRETRPRSRVVQEIPHLLWNSNIYHAHKTRRSPRLFVTLRNTQTKRFVGLSPPNTGDHNLWNAQGCFFQHIQD
jgi:hypothetical protein